MKKMTKIAAAVAALGVMASSLTGCGGGASGAISVITREDGSGTRGAFTELCGIVADDKNNTVSSAEVTNSTAVMLTTVAGNAASIIGTVRIPASVFGSDTANSDFRVLFPSLA